MKCQINRNEFLDHAQVITVIIDGVVFAAAPKEFGTGSFGWHSAGKLMLPCAGKSIPVQVNLLLTVIGSKEERSGKIA